MKIILLFLLASIASAQVTLCVTEGKGKPSNDCWTIKEAAAKSLQSAVDAHKLAAQVARTTPRYATVLELIEVILRDEIARILDVYPTPSMAAAREAERAAALAAKAEAVEKAK